MTAVQSQVSPDKIIRDLWAARGTMALITGIELEVFTHIAHGKQTAKEIAEASEADENATRRLLDALVALEYLTKDGDHYALAPVANFLVIGNQPYMGAFAIESRLNWDAWSRLTE